MSKRFQCWLGNTKLALPFPMIFRMTGNVSRKSFCRCSLPPLSDAPDTPPPLPLKHLPRRLFRHFLTERPVNHLSTQQEVKDIKQAL